MDDDIDDSLFEEIADLIHEYLFDNLINPDGEKVVLIDENGDPLFPQTVTGFPLKEVPGCHEVIRQRMNPVFCRSGWLWN